MAARFCDEIIALKQGHLVARGDPAQIMTPACLEAVYGIPMDVQFTWYATQNRSKS